MSEENKEVVRRFYEEVTAGDTSAFDKYCASDVVLHQAGEADIQGLDGFKELVRMYLSAFPDATTEIHDQAAEGDKVWTRFSHTGTHKGELFGIPASGNRMSITAISVNRLAGGKIVEVWDVTDNMSLMQQIGAIPAPGAEA